MATDDTDTLSYIFLGAWCVLMLMTFYWIGTCGGRCCTWKYCKRGTQFLWFRILVICNTIIMFITWIVNFNPSIQFNPEMHVLYFTNVVSWIDLVVSIFGDIYLTFSNCDCCWSDDKESPAKSSNKNGCKNGWKANLYRLNADGSWDDRGTGLVFCHYNSHPKPNASNVFQELGEPMLVMKSEQAEQTALLRSKVLLREAYHRHGDKILIWREPYDPEDQVQDNRTATGVSKCPWWTGKLTSCFHSLSLKHNL